MTRRLLGVCALVLGLSACSLTLPEPVTISVRAKGANGYAFSPVCEKTPPGQECHEKYNAQDEFKEVSPLMNALTLAGTDARQARMAADAVWRCEQHLNTLYSKMNSSSRSRSAITILGGTLTTSGSLVTGILAAVSSTKKSTAGAPDNSHQSLDIGAVIAAIITASTAVMTVVGSQIPDVKDVDKAYRSAMTKYDKAVDELPKLSDTQDAEWQGHFFSIVKSLHECAAADDQDHGTGTDLNNSAELLKALGTLPTLPKLPAAQGPQTPPTLPQPGVSPGAQPPNQSPAAAPVH